VKEVQHFTEKSTTLFNPHIYNLYKIKLEASGYPRDAVTEEQKKAYVDEIYKVEGLQLDPSAIVLNPGRRLTAKILLNSFWVSFCSLGVS
jgi:hypothetical protein